MLRWFVALTPMVGAIFVPIAVPFAIANYGIASGVITVLILTTLWFVAMLSTSEMPH